MHKNLRFIERKGICKSVLNIFAIQGGNEPQQKYFDLLDKLPTYIFTLMP